MWPERKRVGIFGSHAAYGLYSNTGLYLAGGLTVAAGANITGGIEGAAHIRAAADLYAGYGVFTFSHGIRDGDWTPFVIGVGNIWPQAGTVSFGSAQYKYMYLGRTCFINAHVGFSTQNVQGGLMYLHTPVTATRACWGMVKCNDGTVPSESFVGLAYMAPGTNYLQMGKYNGTNWPTPHALYNLRADDDSTGLGALWKNWS